MNSSSSSFFIFFLLLLCREEATSNRSPGVHLNIQDKSVVIDNGIVQVTLSKADGYVSRIRYHGIDNVLEIHNKEHDRGYWDIVWRNNEFVRLEQTDFKVVLQNENQVEVSFSKTWNPANQSSTLPLNVDKRYIVRRGSSGIYMYTILERLAGWPDADIYQIRVVFKLQKDLFHHMAMSDDRQRIMPMPEDRTSGLPLAYPEAVQLTHPINPALRGEVDDKYQYSCEDKDNKVHGWISEDKLVGFWMITPSDEFRVGGPIKQDLTSHVGPTVLNMFTSTHYAGMDMKTAFRNGEPWKKVLGPVFVYLNSAPPKDDIPRLWADAKEQMSIETESWPYNFVQSKDFPRSDQRGTALGQLLVRDRFIYERLMHASFAYVGLAPPGEAGSWQTDAKGYQFWTKADNHGRFAIGNIRPGVYNLYAWIPGIIGDYKYNINVTVEPGSTIELGFLVFDPPRNGPTLWEIGFPDRTAAEFFVPDPYPTLVNKLYTDRPMDKFRQYGLWQRYADLYHKGDLVYQVGVSNFHQDWFFAHVTRAVGKGTYKATTWQIIFELETVNESGDYTLQLALASATVSELLIRINDPSAEKPLFTTGLIGKDNAIARHGIHGLYWLYTINVPGSQLVEGKNSVYLTQSRSKGPFQGVMYDYIRLEGPRET